MIAGIEGVLQYREPEAAVIKAGAISLRVYAPGSTLSHLGGTGSKVSLYTHLYVREDIIALYGFTSPEELSLFQNLISVSGIGPKVALALLSSLNPEHLTSAIISGNTELLSQTPGIGKKIASRLVLELKGKLEKGWRGTPTPAISAENTDVIAALTSLGYSLREATQAVSSLSQSADLTLEDKVKLALRQLGGK